MTIALGAAFVILSLGSIGVLAYLNIQTRQQLDDVLIAAQTERNKLLERIQRPERPPVTELPDWEPPEPQPDEYEKVGTLNLDGAPE